MLCEFSAAKVAQYMYTYKYLYYAKFFFCNNYLVVWRESNIFAWFL
jgi:hypothetical protein